MFLKKKIKFITRDESRFKKCIVNNDSYRDAKIAFSLDMVFDVRAIGNFDFFKGTAKFVDGLFSVKDLCDAFFSNKEFDEDKCFFVNSTEFDFCIENFTNKIPERRIVIITESIPNVFHVDVNFSKNNKSFSLNQWLKNNNITLITGFSKEKMEFYGRNYLDYQNKGCCVALNDDFLEKKKEVLDFLHNEYNNNKQFNFKENLVGKYTYFQSSKDANIFDIHKNQSGFLQRRGLIPLFEKKYTVLFIDFGASNSSLLLMKYYFNVVVVDYRKIGELYDMYKTKSKTFKINNRKIHGIVLSNTCFDGITLDAGVVENIKNICSLKMPVIGFGFGGNLLCRILGGEIMNSKTTCMLNTYEIRNNENKFFKVSKFNDNYISAIPKGLSASFYDNRNHNIVCCEDRKHICCCFDLMFNGIDTAYIMNKIFNKIKYYIK